MGIGQSALQNVMEDAREEAGAALTLLQRTVGHTARDEGLKLSNATNMGVQLMEDGVTLGIGQSARPNVWEEAKTEPGAALTLLQPMVGQTAREQALKVGHATYMSV